MPPRRSTAGDVVTKKKARKVQKVGAVGRGADTTAQPKRASRPAPVVQPGPIREAERKVVEEFKKKPAYRKIVREVAKAQPPEVKRARRVATLAEGRARSTGFSDAERKKVSAFYETDKFKKALLDSTPAKNRTDFKLRLDAGPRKGVDALAAAVKSDREGGSQKQSVNAGVVKVLDQTLRPVKASAGAYRAVVKGRPQDVPKAVKKGLIDNKGPLYGDVLHKDLGVPKKVAGPVGFGLDVAADPTTYLTLGTGTAARTAAKQAAKKAAKAGMSEAGQKTVARAAAKKASEAPGISVKFGGKEVPGVTRASAAAGQGVKKAAVKASETPGLRKVARKTESIGAGVKDVARDVRPQIRPAGASKAEHEAARQSARVARATVTQGAARAEAEARVLAKQIKPANYETVIDAIERGKIGSLPDELRVPAREIRDSLRHARKVRRRAGLGNAAIRNYFPHAQEDQLLKGLGIVDDATVRPLSRGGRVVPKPGSAKQRELKVPISEANPILAKEGRGKFSTDAPLVYTNYMDDTAKVAARSQLLKDLASAGRPVKPGMVLKEGEKVYHLGFVKENGKGRFGLRPVDDKDIGSKPGQYVALDQKVYDNTIESASPKGAPGEGVMRVYDKGTRAWKFIATASPGFHARNMIGDTQMAYLGQPARKLPGNVKAGGKTLRAVSKMEREPFNRSVSGKTVKVAGKDTPVEEFARLAQQHGVIRSGFIGRELEDLAGETNRRIKRVRKGTGSHVKRWMANREDIMRLATFKSGLDDGLSPGKAADKAMNFHIDYGDLTEFERKVARRAAPFYTFSARALPLHAKALVQAPGKFANIEKARQEVAQAYGFNEDWQEGLQPFQKRQAPFVVKTGGTDYALSAALPLTLLNELPTSTSPTQFLDEIGQFTLGLANPVAKLPIELLANKSMFLRKDIEEEERPLVAAPEWVRYLPESAKKAWGVTDEYVDPRSGTKGLGWNGKPDYVARSIPGVFAFANAMATEKPNRRGQNAEQKALGFVAGVRSEPYDPEGAAVSALWERHKVWKKKRGALRQQKKTAEDPQYREADARVRLIEHQINAISAKRDKVPYFPDAKAPVKNDARIRALEAKAERLSEPLREAAKKGEIVFATPELQKTRDEISRLRDQMPEEPDGRVEPLPPTPAEAAREKVRSVRKRSDPEYLREQARRKIARIRAQQR